MDPQLLSRLRETVRRWGFAALLRGLHQRRWLLAHPGEDPHGVAPFSWSQEVAPSDPSTLEVILRQERDLRVRQAVQHLPPRQRWVVHCHYWENRPFSQMRDGGLSPSNAVRLHLDALRRLRVFLLPPTTS